MIGILTQLPGGGSSLNTWMPGTVYDFSAISSARLSVGQLRQGATSPSALMPIADAGVKILPHPQRLE